MPTPSAAPLPTSPSPGHRADIDGLRGIAVLSVFAVHSIPDAARGGFIGVDVFFVISGYLIALLTLQAQDQGRFSLTGFYARRIRRIVPALLVVLVACLLFAATLAFPRETREIGKHVAGGSAFVSNLVLWREAGYFDRSSEFKPLLHLWSLGIEEQFYLVWPLLALLLARLRHRALWPVLVLLLASFALNLYFVESKPKGTFFLPLTRFWELLIGVVLAQVTHAVAGGPVAGLARRLHLAETGATRLSNAAAVAGVLMLAAAVALIDKTDLFPGAWALLPTLGTASLIAAGPQAWINRRLLSASVLQFYGRISFSLYLWHWPLLTFPLLLGHRLSVLAQIAVLCLSVGLALVTYRWVELPARTRRRAPFTVPWLLGGLVLVGAAGLALFQSDGLLQRYPAALRPVAAVHGHDDYPAYRVERCFLRSEQPASAWGPECIDAPAPQPSGSPQLLWLWGDSHAAALYPGLRGQLTALAPGWRLAQTTAALCPPLAAPRERFSAPCAGVYDRALELIAQHRPDVVVLAGAWATYRTAQDSDDRALQGLLDTVARLRALGVKRVMVVGPLPQWQAPLPGLLLGRWQMLGDTPELMASGLLAHPLLVEPEVQAVALAAGAEFHSLQRQLCTASGCRTALPSGGTWLPTAFDESHLTVAGSNEVARGLLQRVTQGQPRQ